jgi:hypothetical protein
MTGWSRMTGTSGWSRMIGLPGFSRMTGMPGGGGYPVCPVLPDGVG